MTTIEESLANWRTSVRHVIPIGGLISRNATVYKWKAPMRCWYLHEGLFWRMTDLLTQSHLLHRQGHGLGAHILLRSGLETLAILIHLNQQIDGVLEGRASFNQFSEKTTELLLGARDGSTGYSAINILTVLEKCEKRYPGIKGIYDGLSESAHPNFEGVATGFSVFNVDEYDIHFGNRWMDLYNGRHHDTMKSCIDVFEQEHSEVWPELMEKLENWIVMHDAELEAAKAFGNGLS